jgi:hypothetical protein
MEETLVFGTAFTTEGMKTYELRRFSSGDLWCLVVYTVKGTGHTVEAQGH